MPSIVDCVLFDVRNTSTSESGALMALKSAVGETPIIVLTGFPRIEDIERLKSAGATAVVAKPFLADDLLWQIEQSLPQFALGE
jgi:CheY-like chemotaxis protein